MKDQKEKGSPVRIGITVGDINGVGPETVLKVLSDSRLFSNATPIIYGSNSLIKFMKSHMDLNQFNFNGIKVTDEAKPRKVNCLNLWEEDFEPEFGQATKKSGELALKSLQAAVSDLASNKIDVLVTSPINKDTIQSAEFDFPGHTEYLASMSNVEDYLMFLVADDLRVGVVTGHIALKDVASNLTSDKIVSKLKLMTDSLSKDFGVSIPKIAVLGLNPHAGDNGLLGEEEKSIILPAIREAQDSGLYVYGPFGADGFFGSPAYKDFDAILAMYHDQGLTPFKAMAFDRGVNFTAGLPIVRTSPDHGTGYDIAGKGAASPDSLRNAIFTAIDVYNNRRDYKVLTANPLEIKPKKKRAEAES
jgi:4-hydroxythreonine-4-phosphate dehydrogenase